MLVIVKGLRTRQKKAQVIITLAEKESKSSPKEKEENKEVFLLIETSISLDEPSKSFGSQQARDDGKKGGAFQTRSAGVRSVIAG